MGSPGNLSPLIQPIWVERPVQFDVNGIVYSGQIDLADEMGRIRDTKTTGSRPRPGSYTFGMTGYALAARQATGEIETDVVLDYLVATKTPYYHPVSSGGPVSNDNLVRFVNTVESVAEAIEAGKFVPNGVQGFGVCESMCGYKDICPYYMGKKAPSRPRRVRSRWHPEKAETSAIARCSAVAGLGNGAALDLDEGHEQDRVSDTAMVRPIVIRPSDVPGIRQGGRQTTISTAQINEIARLTRTLAIGDGLVPLIEEVSGTVVPLLETGLHPNARFLKGLMALTFDQAATLVRRLTAERSSLPSQHRPSLRGRPLEPSRSASSDGHGSTNGTGRHSWPGDAR